MSQAPDELRARIEAIKAKMTGGAAPAAAPAAAAPAAATPCGRRQARRRPLRRPLRRRPAATWPRVAAIKAKMAGGAAPPRLRGAAARARRGGGCGPAAAAPAASRADVATASRRSRPRWRPAGARGASRHRGRRPSPRPSSPRAAKAPAGKPIWPVQPIDRTSFGEGAPLRARRAGALVHAGRRGADGGRGAHAAPRLGARLEGLPEPVPRDQDRPRAAGGAGRRGGHRQGQAAQLQADAAAAEAQVAARCRHRAPAEGMGGADGELFRDDQTAKFKVEFDALRYQYEELRVEAGRGHGRAGRLGTPS